MSTYRGRFAPSPTGPLHFGSLVAALGSCLEARKRGGLWLVRMEDIDPPREQPGAADEILRTLEAFGFEWDGEVLRQSHRASAYALATERLEARGIVFPCACTRREISGFARSVDGEPIYPGTCRRVIPRGHIARSRRVRVGDAVIAFEDAIQGDVVQHLEQEVGDFVIARAQGLYAYQLAVVVDDAHQGISEIVRGADLLGCTARQIFLQRLLGVPTPRYAHLPVAVNSRGEKLSKQTRARPLDARAPTKALAAALSFLGQSPPAHLDRTTARDLWSWARENWDLARVPRRRSLPTPGNL